jgi:hypothetical protein
MTLFGVEHGRSADRAEPECESGALVTDANVLGGGAEDLVGSGETGESREDTARSTLAGKAVANAHAPGFALHFDAQLAAGTRGGSRMH